MTRSILNLAGLLVLGLAAACAPAATPERARAPQQDGIYAAPAGQSGEGEIEGALYEWTGTVIASDNESPHLELDRGCDAWVLLPQSDETEQKLDGSIGVRLIVRGKVFPGPTIFIRPAIAVFSAFGVEEPVPMPATPIPEYPCPQTPAAVDASPVPTPLVEVTPTPMAAAAPVATEQAIPSPEPTAVPEETPAPTPVAEPSPTPGGMDRRCQAASTRRAASVPVWTRLRPCRVSTRPWDA